MSKNSPLVSICMITYNHEKYIAEAIEGVLMQEVDFNIELIIADDCSTDRTGEIVQSLIEKHPNGTLIKYTCHPINKGMMENFIWSINQASGKYIALCEGDDYWIDCKKLQIQVEFLNNNPEYSLVGHQARKVFTKGDNSKIIGSFKRNVFKNSDRDFLFLPIPTATILFRNQISFPNWVYSVYGGDTALIYLALQKGWIGVLNLVGSIYRIHPGGMEQNFKKDKVSLPLRNIKQYSVYYKIIDRNRKNKLAKKLSWNHFYLSIQFMLRVNLIKVFYHLAYCFYWKIKTLEISY